VSTHEDELKQGALKSLNEGLLTEMKIDTLSYSFFAHFPNASLRCQNVVLFDTFEDRDTLLWAKELSLEVSCLTSSQAITALTKSGFLMAECT